MINVFHETCFFLEQQKVRTENVVYVEVYEKKIAWEDYERVSDHWYESSVLDIYHDQTKVIIVALTPLSEMEGSAPIYSFLKLPYGEDQTKMVEVFGTNQHIPMQVLEYLSDVEEKEFDLIPKNVEKYIRNK